MTKIKDNTDIIKLLPQEQAKFNLVMAEIRGMKKKGANGETVGAERHIISGIMERYFIKLKMVEKQVADKVYHENWFKRFVWKIKERIKAWKR